MYVILLLLLNVDHSPYIAEVVEQTSQNDEYTHIYAYLDINDDGISEQILVYNLRTNGTIISYNPNGTIYESWNLYGKYYMQPVFDFYDINKDQIPEIYAITLTLDDSVFVNQAELKTRANNSRKKFVTKLERYNGHLDAVMDGLGFSDITGDGTADFLFSISAGFTLQPRAVYAWDIKNDTILRSPFCGIPVKYNHGLITADVDEDGISEIFLPTWSTDNYKTPVPCSDTASYSLVLTKNLDYLYQPVLIAGPSSVSSSFPMMMNDTLFILTIPRMVREHGNDSKAVLFNIHGDIKDSLWLKNMNTNTSYRYINGRILYASLGDGTTTLGTIEDDLSLKKHRNIEGDPKGIIAADLDNDPAAEVILLDTKTGILHILQDDLKTLTSCRIPSERSSLLRISIASKSDSETRFLIQMSDYRMMVSYSDNQFYNWRFLYYLLLYGIIYLILFLLQKVFLFRSNRKKVKEERMIRLQLQSVMNQLNPHFTFNAINTVGDSILNDRKQEAYENLTKLSELIRSSMDNAFQVHKSLGEEIEFTRRYLELESVRFESKLSFSFNISSNVDLEMKVPKMLLHLFVENAIKHGIFHKSSQGHISVTATREQNETVITITDDGIGRKSALSISGDKGKGLQILNEYLDLFRKNYQREIIYTLEDLYDRAEHPGTKVTIRIRY